MIFIVANTIAHLLPWGPSFTTYTVLYILLALIADYLLRKSNAPLQSTFLMKGTGMVCPFLARADLLDRWTLTIPDVPVICQCTPTQRAKALAGRSVYWNCIYGARGHDLCLRYSE
jgi:hypothetical protein